MSKLLAEDRKHLARFEKRCLLKLHGVVQDLGVGTEEDLSVLADAADQLDELFMVCIVGEFNAGKSAFINALLGESFCKEGVIPTTAKVCILRHDPLGEGVISRGARGDHDSEELRLPVPWLDDVCLVDTPGTNAIVHGHSQITERVIPRADLVFFVTSSDRPFSESEKAFLERIRDWRKKVVLVLNKIDLFDTEDQLRQVKDFVSINGAALLGSSAPVFPVSAKLALKAKRAALPSADPRLGSAVEDWERSGFEALEGHMRDELSDEAKVRSKLLSPLGVAESVAARAAGKVSERREALKSDEMLLELVDEQLSSFMADLERDAAFERLQIDKALDRMRERSVAFIDRRVSITNAAELLDAEAFKRSFEAEAVGSTARDIDSIVRDVAEMVTKRARAQSAAVMEYVARAPRHKQSILGSASAPSAFYTDRQELQDKLSYSVHLALSRVDQNKEVEKLSSAVKASLTESTAVGAGAATVGGLAVAGVLGDVTGVVAASSLAVMGLLVLPLRRWQAKQRFGEAVEEVKKQMDEALQTHLERELHRVQEHILDGVAPYRRFVELEGEKMADSEKRLRDVRAELQSLRDRV